MSYALTTDFMGNVTICYIVESVVSIPSIKSGGFRGVPAGTSVRLSKLGSLSTKASSSDIRQLRQPKRQDKKDDKTQTKNKSNSN